MHRASRHRIILADDHQMVSEALKRLIDSQVEMVVVGMAYDGLELLERLSTVSADLVVLDIGMPKLGGVEALKVIRSEYPSLRIMVLSSHDDGELIKEVMRLGAHGYMVKSDSAELLIEGIRTVMDGKKVLDMRLTHRMDRAANQVEEQHCVKVSPREQEILDLIADGLTSKEMSGKLHISENTVITHRRKLFEKFEVSNGASLVRKAIALGLVEV